MYRKIRAESINSSHINNDNLLLSSSPGSSTSLSNESTTFKEPIEWLQMDRYTNKLQSNIVLILGYKSGISLWSIDTNGLANCLLNIKDINITYAKLITSANRFCLIKNKQTIEFYDLTNGTLIPNTIALGLNDFITDIKSNAKLIVFKLNTNRLIAYDLISFKYKFSINLQIDNIVFALNTRWLAFGDCNYYNIYSSQGGLTQDTADEIKTYTATVIQTAKILKKKIQLSLQNQLEASMHQQQQQPHQSQQQDGICTIIDTYKYTGNTSPYTQDDINDKKWIIAHFKAHLNSKIHLLEFSPNGSLLVTCDSNGCYFNVFKIFNSPAYRTQVKHLYILYRGDTTCKALNICFSYDSRYVCVSTNHGTTHVFPINSYGGHINARTHLKPFVVNKLSRHNRTAGFQIQNQNEITNEVTNPKLKSLKEPFIINSLAQIKTGGNIIENLASLSFTQHENSLHVASVFGDTRGYLSPEEPKDVNKNRLKCIPSLFVFNNQTGNLIEYKLDVHLAQNKPPSNDSPIQLRVLPKAQWPLQRSIRDSCSSPVSFKFLSDLKNSQYSNQQQITQTTTNGQTEWIRLVESTTHIEPHRRLFMGPQFIFKTIQSLTNTYDNNNLSSSSILNATIDNSTITNNDLLIQSEPIRINFKKQPSLASWNTQPTYIEVGPGSYQEDMPYFSKSNESYKSDSLLIENLADAMQDEQQLNLNHFKTAPIDINTDTNTILISTSNNSNNDDILVDYSNSNSSATFSNASNGSIPRANPNEYSFDNFHFNDDS